MASDFFIGDSAVANQCNTMIDFPVGTRTAEVRLSNDSVTVRHEHASGINPDANGLLLKDLFHLVIRHLVFLNLPSISEVNGLVTLQAATHLSHVSARVVALKQNSILCHVLVGLEHPSSYTLEVI